jgi:hypothetical protein
MSKIIKNPVVIGNKLATKDVVTFRQLKDKAQVLFPMDKDVITNIESKFEREVIEAERRSRCLIGEVAIVDNGQWMIISQKVWETASYFFKAVGCGKIQAFKFFNKMFGWDANEIALITKVWEEHKSDPPKIIT